MEADSLKYGLLALVVIFVVHRFLDSTPNLDFIPSVGPSGKLTSYIGALKFLINGSSMVESGLAKYKNAMFKVPYIDKWVVVVSTPQLVDDIRQARDEDLSFSVAVNELITARYTLGEDIVANAFHVQVVRARLTRSLSACYPDIHDEIVQAFKDTIILSGDEWTSVPAYGIMMQIVCRAVNRLFVGLPLCRDQEFCDLSTRFTVNVFLVSSFMKFFSKRLHPVIGPLVSPRARSLKRAEKFLVPLIRQRMQEDAEYGKGRANRPNDLISWLLDEAPEGHTARQIAMRVLVVNFASIHSTSNAFTQALYHLASEPQHVASLRDEIDTVIRQEGWTRTAISKLQKVDSFIREVVRFSAPGCLNMERVVTNPSGFTFSNGTTLPQGTTLAVATLAIQHDEASYPSAHKFDGFRFSKLNEADPSSKQLMVNTSCDYIVFGHGRHACPGRYFAADELKTMFAHVVANYDVKLAGGKMPPPHWVGSQCVPNMNAHILFRKRQD